jgi:hypothetical protein
MRRASWFVPTYAAAACGLVMALRSGDPLMERAGAMIPFAVLVAAMAAGRHAAGWSCATAGMVLTALSPMAAVTVSGGPGGWLAVACAVLAGAMMTIAMTQAGAWRIMRRHRWIATLLSMFAGLVLLASLSVIAVTLHVLLRSHPGCTGMGGCMGYSVYFLLGAGALIELVAFTMVAVAFAASWAAGLGGLTVVIAEHVLGGYGEPRPSVSYAAAVVAWYAGALVITRQWTRPWRTAPGLTALTGEAGP